MLLISSLLHVLRGVLAYTALSRMLTVGADGGAADEGKTGPTFSSMTVLKERVVNLGVKRSAERAALLLIAIMDRWTEGKVTQERHSEVVVRLQTPEVGWWGISNERDAGAK